MLKYVFLHIVLLKFKNIYLPTTNIQWLVFFYAFLAEIRRKNEENFGRLLWKSYVLV